MNSKIESICNLFYKSGVIDEEDEEILVDYLYSKGVKINLDFPKENLCDKILLKNKINIEEYKKNLFKETEMDDNIKYYGNLDINIFLNIAMRSDDRTLLTMMNISKIHREKFKDDFFKKYLQLHYPNIIQFKPLDKSFKQYYLELIYAIDMLKRKYKFEYLPEENYDVLKTYKDVVRIDNAKLNYRGYLDTVKMLNN